MERAVNLVEQTLDLIVVVLAIATVAIVGLFSAVFSAGLLHPQLPPTLPILIGFGAAAATATARSIWNKLSSPR